MRLPGPFFIAVISASLFFGCATTTVVKRGEPFTLDKKAAVFASEGRVLTVRNARVQDDSLIVLEYDNHWEKRLPLSSIGKVVVLNRIKGVQQGLGIGGVAGGLAGGFIGLVSASNAAPCRTECYFTIPPPVVGIFSGILGAGIGAGVGAVVGASVGNRQIFLFESDDAHPEVPDAAVKDTGKVKADPTQPP